MREGQTARYQMYAVLPRSYSRGTELMNSGGVESIEQLNSPPPRQIPSTQLGP